MHRWSEPQRGFLMIVWSQMKWAVSEWRVLLEVPRHPCRGGRQVVETASFIIAPECLRHPLRHRHVETTSFIKGFMCSSIPINIGTQIREHACGRPAYLIKRHFEKQLHVCRTDEVSHKGDSSWSCEARWSEQFWNDVICWKGAGPLIIPYQYLISSYKSFHSGLTFTIKATFFILEYFLICFSLSIASSME